MTTFNYTGGAFSNLVGGTPGANVSNLVQLLNDLKTFLNGANLDATNIAPVPDTLLASPTNAVWRTVLPSYFPVLSLTTASFYASTNGLNASGSAGGITAQGVWVPPSSGDIAVAGKTTRMRLRVSWLTNATAPGITITWGLYPVTGLAGGAGLISVTMGTVIAGSTAAAVTPAVTTAGVSTGASFDFSAITGGTAYILGVAGSGSQAANSLVAANAILEMRHT